MLILFSAGNYGAEGPSSVYSPKNAKNALVVGATESGTWFTHPRSRNDPSSVAYFSSVGPTFDGRIKPDLVAPGYWIMSSSAGSNPNRKSCDVHHSSGTSMATPVLAGAAALAREVVGARRHRRRRRRALRSHRSRVDKSNPRDAATTFPPSALSLAPSRARTRCGSAPSFGTVLCGRLLRAPRDRHRELLWPPRVLRALPVRAVQRLRAGAQGGAHRGRRAHALGRSRQLQRGSGTRPGAARRLDRARHVPGA